MLKKRIYLPEACKERGCPHYNQLVNACKNCPIYEASERERAKRIAESHRKAATKYYNKNVSGN